MNIKILVKIKDAGTGTDATIGLLDGNLIWASHGGLAGYTDGIIDNNSISGVSNSINIVNGGGLGGLEGTLTMSAINPNLHAPLIDGTISIIGKLIEVYVTDGVVNSCRYSGKVSTWELQDEATIEITSDPVSALDLLKIPSITIDDGMSLGLSGSVANGKTIEKVYGNICDFPLIYVPSESVYTSAMLNPYLGITIDAFATRLDAGDQMLDGNGNFRAINIIQILGKYQETETENVKICFSVNGRPLFTSYSGLISDYVKKQLTGSAIKIVRGTGDGNIYNILDAEYETHTLGDISTSTIWFTIDTNDISAITDASGFQDLNDSTDRTSHYLFNNYFGVVNQAWNDERFVAPYDNGLVAQNVSCVQIIGASNIYIVSSDADLSGSLSLIGESNENEVVIPSDGVRVLYETDSWKMIRVEAGNNVVDSQNEYIVKQSIQVDTRVLEPLSSANPLNMIATNSFGNGYYQNVVACSEVDGTLISAELNTANFASGTYSDYVAFNNVQTIEIDSVLNGVDLSNPDLSISIVPNISYGVVPSRTSAGNGGISLYIDIHSVSNANLILSKKRITRYYACNEWSLSSMSQNTLHIYASNQIVDFPVSATNYFGSGESAFASLLEDCDITDIVKSNAKGDIRYIVISVKIRMNTYSGLNGDPQSAECTSIIYPASVFYSTKVAKEGLYLRATKTQSTADDILSPSDIVRQLATETGNITIDTASFDAVQASQTAMMTSYWPLDPVYKGQIIAGNSTISEIFDKIGKQTMTAFYTEANNTDTGVVKLRAKWFSDDETPTYTIQPFEIVKGSFSVSKPDGGMVFTDYNFKFTKTAFGTTDALSVNTDESATFPDSDYIETYGAIYGVATGYTIDTVDKYTDTNIVRVLDTTSDKIILSKFNVGTKWKLFDIDDVAVIATITHISYEFSKYLEMGKSCNIAFKYDDPHGDLSAYDVVSFQSIGSHYKWQDCVTGNAGANYTDAKNIWEYAKASRLHLGLNRAMPSDYTTISDPIWGSDARALRQFALYVTKWNAREKTIVKLSVPMTSEMLAFKLLQFVEVSFGVFAATHISGYIVDMADDYSNATISLTILCPKSADALLTILNENYASADLTIDERTTDTIANYNEGLLA
jgi:hypothetical protein